MAACARGWGLRHRWGLRRECKLKTTPRKNQNILQEGNVKHVWWNTGLKCTCRYQLCPNSGAASFRESPILKIPRWITSIPDQPRVRWVDPSGGNKHIAGNKLAMQAAEVQQAPGSKSFQFGLHGLGFADLSRDSAVSVLWVKPQCDRSLRKLYKRNVRRDDNCRSLGYVQWKQKGWW